MAKQVLLPLVFLRALTVFKDGSCLLCLDAAAMLKEEYLLRLCIRKADY